MAAGYWRHATDPRPATLKRPLPEYLGAPVGPEMLGYYPHDQPIRGFGTISSSGPDQPVKFVPGGMTGPPVHDPRVMGVGGRTEPALPPDASRTIYVEGLPATCSRREVSHIFRPFVGFREVRLVNKGSRIFGDAFLLCFVDFATESQAAVALDALQGYKFDEHERDSANLRLQFARVPGPRSAGRPRGRR